MAGIISRLTSSGNLILNGTFNEVSSSVVTNGLITYLDAGNIASYSGTGTAITDLSKSSANGTINGTISFVNSGSASYWNFATVSDANYISSTVSQSYKDFTIVFYPDNTLVAGIVGLLADSAPATASDDSLRFTGANGVGPWTLAGRNPGDTNDWAYPTATTYYVNGVASNVLSLGWNIFGGYRTNTTGFPASWPYFIGTSGYPARGFQGKIAAVLLYDRQLTANEQLQNYNALAERFNLSIKPYTSPALISVTPTTMYASEFDEVTYNTIAPAIKNLLTYSEQYINWVLNISVVTSDQLIAPNGKLTADRIVADPLGYVVETINTTAGLAYTLSFWIKSVSGATGTWGVNWYTSTSGHHRLTVPITGSWNRVSITFTTDNILTNIYISDNRSALATINDAYVWGAQFEVGLVPTIYQGIAAANTLVDPGFAQRTDNTGVSYVKGEFDEVTGAPITDGLVLYLDAMVPASYPGTGTTWSDLSGNNNHFTLFNAPTFSSEKLIFNGVNQYAVSANPLNLTSYNAITVEIFFKVSTVTAAIAYEHTINWNANAGGFGLAPHSNGGVTTTDLHHTNHNTEGVLNYSFVVGTQWAAHTMVFSKIVNAAGRKAYGNGAFISSAATVAGSFANAVFYIGARAGTGSYLNGQVSSIKIYNRELSAAEIQQNFNAQRGRFGI